MVGCSVQIKRLTTLIVAFILSLSFALSSGVPVLAFNEFYANNDILFYNPNDADTVAENDCTEETPIALTKNPQLEQIFQLLLNGGMSTIQAAAVMGNMQAESGFNPNAHEFTAGSAKDLAGGGFGLVQWSFGRRTNLSTFAGTTDPADVTVQINFLLKEYNESYKSRLDIATKTDRNGWNGTDLALATASWMRIFEVPAESTAHLPRRISAASTIYGFYESLAPGSPVATVSSGSCYNGVVAGNIIKTAVNFALPTPATDTMNTEHYASAAYKVAKNQYNPTVDWTDCGGFIATVMIASGADPDYANVYVPTQMTYVRNSPKYKVIENPVPSDLMPGDILLTGSHTILYVGPTVVGGVTYETIDASYTQRVPSMRNGTGASWITNNGAIIARLL